MQVRIEICPNKTSNWSWVLRIFKQHPSYDYEKDAGVEVHCITLCELEFPLFAHIEHLTQTWRTINFLLDGEYETRYRAFEILLDAFEKVDAVEAEIERSKRLLRQKRESETDNDSGL